MISLGRRTAGLILTEHTELVSVGLSFCIIVWEGPRSKYSSRDVGLYAWLRMVFKLHYQRRGSLFYFPDSKLQEKLKVNLHIDTNEHREQEVAQELFG